MALRTIVVTLLAVLAATLGDICVAMALKSPAPFLNWHLWVGIGLLFTHFVLWLAVLSWADLSLAFPLKASNYVFNAMLVGLMLHESVTLIRWLGTLVVALGVFMVSLSAPQPDPVPSYAEYELDELSLAALQPASVPARSSRP
jgi:drug/metabolite transporter (DMT)-like permease